MAAISTTDLFKAYLAYFGRPPDVAGLSFYTTANGGVPEKDVVNGFYASAESQAFFGSMPLAEQINQIYNNLFNRDVEADGLLYWMSRIQGDIVVNGVVVPQLNLAEAAMGILRGAQNGDLDTVNAKVAASQRFVAAMDTAPEWSGYAGEEAANDAREFLAGVGVGSTPTDAEVNAAVLKATTPNVPPPPPPPTYDVTPSAASVDEGQTVIFTISTTNVPEGTRLSYEIAGINAADLQSGLLVGEVRIDESGQALVQVTLKNDLSTNEGNETMTFTLGAGLDAVQVIVNDTSFAPPTPGVVDQTLSLTPLAGEVVNGGAGNDTINGVITASPTTTTLQAGDVINGGAGNDTLKINVSGLVTSSVYDGFETNSVETVWVKSISSSDVTLDVSDVNYNTDRADKGVQLFSYETDGADLTFWDIQKMSETSIRIQDTDEDHYFVYDAGNSAVRDNKDGKPVDLVRIEVSEMRGIADGPDTWYGTSTDPKNNITGAGIFLENNAYDTQDTLWESYADKIELTSTETGQSSLAKKNIIQLYSGEDLDELVINGKADLEITNILDQNIRLVDASAHEDNSRDNRADLILNLSHSSIDEPMYGNETDFWWTDDANEDGFVQDQGFRFQNGAVPEITVLGSQGDDLITFVHPASQAALRETVQAYSTNDKLINLGTGNDTVHTGYEGDGTQRDGEASINAGSGNDFVYTGRHNDKVWGEGGNDTIVDQGSTSAYAVGDQSGVDPDTGEPTYYRYNPSYSQDGNWFDLGIGNDKLTVKNNSNDTVYGQAGNDSVVVAGSVVDQFANDTVFTSVVSHFDLGQGNDTLSVGNVRDNAWGGSRGSVMVIGDDSTAGNDIITIARDGDQTVYAGAGNDQVKILQDSNQWSSDHFDQNGPADEDNANDRVYDGNHLVDLGEGNDSLLITGHSNVLFVTTVTGGGGNDAVTIEQDHQLLVDLGGDSDSLKIRAEDLHSDDTIVGGTGYDTVILTNTTHSSDTGKVRASETRDVTGVEQFNLLNSGILVELTDNLVGGSDNMVGGKHKFVVDTQGSTYPDLPILIDPLYQGMLWSAYMAWENGVTEDKPNNIDPRIVPMRTVVDPLTPALDVVFFRYGDDVYVPAQTVDLTALDTVNYTFQLVGGSLRDIVIADEDAISDDLVMNFDGTPGQDGREAFEGWAFTDTLRVVDEATIRTADLKNVNNLEIIELVASANSAGQEWEIELNNHVINQTTGTANLIIRVDPNVPANSVLNIVWSENDTNMADTNVIVEANANVVVNIVTRNPNGTRSYHEVTQDEYNEPVSFTGFDFGNGKGVIVKTAQYFTENGDNLWGVYGNGAEPANNDTFIATSLSQVQSGDSVDGNPEQGDNGDGNDVLERDTQDQDFDTVELRFNVAAASSLASQLNDVDLWDIEHINFNTRNQVKMDGIGSGFATDLTHISTGSSADRLTNIERDELWFTLNGGNDLLDVEDGADATVSGGEGNDTVTGDSGSFLADGNNRFWLGSVEYVETYEGTDEVIYSHTLADRWGNLLGGNDGNIYVDLGDGGTRTGDMLVLDNDGTNGLATVKDAETIYGGDAGDWIDAEQRGPNGDYMRIWGDGDGNGYSNSTVGGNDTITARGNADDSIYVYGEQGDDWISANTDSGGGTSLVYVEGGIGADTLYAGTGTPDRTTVYGGEGNDWIFARAEDSVRADGDAGVDHMVVYAGSNWADNSGDASVNGGEDGDFIFVEASDDATIHGDDGDDVIVFHVNNADGNNTVGGTWVHGDAGNDTIRNADMTVYTDGDGNLQHSIIAGSGSEADVTIEGGNGDDTIYLQALDADKDTIVFGNIDYAAVGNPRPQTSNTQGFDTIVNFGIENPVGPDTAFATGQDVLNFNQFLTGSNSTDSFTGTWVNTTTLAKSGGVIYGDWRGANHVLDMDNGGSELQPGFSEGTPHDNRVAVITVSNTFSAADLRARLVVDTNTGDNTATSGGQTLLMDDGARSVVILAKDSTPNNSENGYDTFEVYFVQDTDSSMTNGSAVWQVDLVATVQASASVGATVASFEASQFTW